ncbi:MAG: hypothetical protein PHX83_12565 [Acidobacteriia bacterium]|nr:hypothetical protein [Terriglobia bacterium]
MELGEPEPELKWPVWRRTHGEAGPPPVNGRIAPVEKIGLERRVHVDPVAFMISPFEKNKNTSKADVIKQTRRAGLLEDILSGFRFIALISFDRFCEFIATFLF